MFGRPANATAIGIGTSSDLSEGKCNLCAVPDVAGGGGARAVPGQRRHHGTARVTLLVPCTRGSCRQYMSPHRCMIIAR